MKILMITIMGLFLVMPIVGHSSEHQQEDSGMKEKIVEKGRKAKRSVKKALNRTKEALCTEGDVKCEAKKIKHRMDETKDLIIDKSKDLKNKID